MTCRRFRGLVEHLRLRTLGLRDLHATALEVQFPTAGNNQIGTGKTDYTGILIFSKLVGGVDFHLNLGYTIIGQPAGVMAKNMYNGAFTAIFPITKRVEDIAEVYGNTSAAINGETGDIPTSASSA